MEASRVTWRLLSSPSLSCFFTKRYQIKVKISMHTQHNTTPLHNLNLKLNCKCRFIIVKHMSTVNPGYFTLFRKPLKTYLYLSSRVIHLLCSDSVASPSQWLLNPDRSIRAPKALGPCPGMRWQNSGENPGENCRGEHLNVLLAPHLSGKHLGGGSKPTPTENHSTQLYVGVEDDTNLMLFNCFVSFFGPLLNIHLHRESNVY